MKFIFLLLVFLFIPLASSLNQINYTIHKNEVFVSLIHEKDTIIKLPGDYSNFSSTSKYFIKNGLLYIYGKGQIQYNTKLFIESKKGNFFIVSGEDNLNSQIRIKLPLGSSLSEKYPVYPKGYVLETDGQTITLIWNQLGQKEIFVPYELKKNELPLYVTIFVILFAGGISFFYSKLIKKEKLTTNLFKDEKKIIELLLKKKDHSSWTKNLVRESDLTKVKLSRTLRKLEEKNLIEKIPYGNENLIKLKK